MLLPIFMLTINIAAILAIMWFGGIHNMEVGAITAFVNYTPCILHILNSNIIDGLHVSTAR